MIIFIVFGRKYSKKKKERLRGIDSCNNSSLTVGNRGPTLLQDFLFIEKIAHFDRECIPERVVHAKGAGAFGYFQVYKSMAKYTKAQFLQEPSAKTPVFVRFSTVAGGRGSADTVRDVRGFATKFYTKEGNYDLVGNDIAHLGILGSGNSGQLQKDGGLRSQYLQMGQQ